MMCFRDKSTLGLAGRHHGASFGSAVRQAQHGAAAARQSCQPPPRGRGLAPRPHRFSHPLSYVAVSSRPFSPLSSLSPLFLPLCIRISSAVLSKAWNTGRGAGKVRLMGMPLSTSTQRALPRYRFHTRTADHIPPPVL